MSEVSIRAFEMTHWEDVAEIRLAPKSQRGTLQMPYQSRDEIKRRFEDPNFKGHRLVAVHHETEKVVGIIGLHTMRGRRAHVAGLGMAVHDDYQNQGIGSKLLEAALDLAENWLNLTRIELTVYTDNPGAIHLYEKFGFVIEGTLQQYAFRDGVYVDAYAMARIRR